MQRCRSSLSEHAHSITLQQDADDAVIGAEDDDRTDASLGQQLYRRGKIGVRLIVTTLPRLPTKMFLTIMAASLIPAAAG